MRTDNARRRAVRGRALPARGQHVPRVRARRRARSRARPVQPGVLPDGRFAAVVQAPDTETRPRPDRRLRRSHRSARPHAHERAGLRNRHGRPTAASSRSPAATTSTSCRPRAAPRAACSRAASSPTWITAAACRVRRHPPVRVSGRSAIVTACAAAAGACDRDAALRKPAGGAPQRPRRHRRDGDGAVPPGRRAGCAPTFASRSRTWGRRSRRRRATMNANSRITPSQIRSNTTISSTPRTKQAMASQVMGGSAGRAVRRSGRAGPAARAGTGTTATARGSASRARRRSPSPRASRWPRRPRPA